LIQKYWRLAAGALVIVTALAGLRAGAAADVDAREVPVLSEANLDQWLTHVRPSAEEVAFEQIQWRPTLWQAAVDANKADKPVLLWAMNGHPLGCT